MAALGFVACFFFFQAEDGIRDKLVTGVQTCALPIYRRRPRHARGGGPRARFAAAPRGRGRPRAGARAPARAGGGRSEERRVGKESRSRWSPYHLKKTRKISITTTTG